MEAEAIEKIKEMAMENFMVERDGVLFTAKSMKPVTYEPVPECVNVSSLKAFCAWITQYKPEGFISVDTPQSVCFISDNERIDRQCVKLIHAQVSRNLSSFPFDTFLSQEEFAIKFRSLFCASADAEYVLSYVAKITNNATAITEDDGITQTCSVRTGISGHLNTKETVRPIVTLAPWRTFREIAQPLSEFLFRVKVDKDEAPRIALFEADGGSWTLQAQADIADFIRANIPDNYLILA